MKVYKAHIIHTPQPQRFETIENGYVAVGDDGRVISVAADLETLGCPNAEVTDFGNRLLIPAMNDVHVHAAQYRNQGIAMDLELLPWLDRYTFPEEVKFSDTGYAELVYRRFIRHLWRVGTMRAAVFATTHTPATRRLMELFDEAGMGALVGKVAMDRNCPDSLAETVDDYLRGMEELTEEYGGPAGTGTAHRHAALHSLVYARNAEGLRRDGTPSSAASTVAPVGESVGDSLSA